MKEIFSKDGNRLTRENVRLEWSELGEGLGGDYDPNDLEDIELLRFDLFVKINGKWIDPGDASYCTQVPVSATKKQRMALLKFLMDEIYDAATQYPASSVKKPCERLSWISLDSLKDNAITVGKWAFHG